MCVRCAENHKEDSRYGANTTPPVAGTATTPSGGTDYDGFTGQTTIFGKGRPRTKGLPAEHKLQLNDSHRPVHGRSLCTRCSGSTGAAYSTLLWPERQTWRPDSPSYHYSTLHT